MGTFVPKSSDEYVEELSGDFDRIIKDFKNDIENMNENNNSDEDFWDEYYEKLSKLIENMREKLSENGVHLPSGVYNDYMKKGTKEIFKRINDIVWGKQ